MWYNYFSRLKKTPVTLHLVVEITINFTINKNPSLSLNSAILRRPNCFLFFLDLINDLKVIDLGTEYNHFTINYILWFIFLYKLGQLAYKNGLLSQRNETHYDRIFHTPSPNCTDNNKYRLNWMIHVKMTSPDVTDWDERWRKHDRHTS